MKCPAEVYTASARPYDGIPEPHYPFHDQTVVVTNCGRLCLYSKKINLSSCLAGQAVGVKEVDDGIWLVSFMDYDLGYIDLEEKTLQPLDNPFGPKVLPMSQERSVTYVSGPDRNLLAEREGFEPPVPVKVQRFSRPPVSTAHTPLRVIGINSLPVLDNRRWNMSGPLCA